MLCLLLSALGFVEFEEIWNPREHEMIARTEEAAVFSSLQMTSRKGNEILSRHLSDRKPEPIQVIPERDIYREAFLCRLSNPCRLLIVIAERAVEKKIREEEANIEYVYLIPR